MRIIIQGSTHVMTKNTQPRKVRDAINILKRIGSNLLLATVKTGGGQVATVEIYTDSPNGAGHMILSERPLFKENNGQIITKEEWIAFLRQRKEVLTKDMRQESFLRVGKGTFSGDLIGICSTTKEQQQRVSKEFEEFVHEMVITSAKFKALVSI